MGPLPPAATSHYLAGELALYSGANARAADELVLAAAAAPDQPVIGVEEARALAKAGRTGRARAVLAELRARWPDHPQVWLESGELLEKAAPAEAEAAYRRAIALARDEERAYLGLARVQLALGHARDAELTLRTLVIRLPGSVDGRYRLAQRLAARGDLKDTVIQLRAVLERDPDQLDARLDLARALRLTGDLAGAVAQTRSAFDRAGQPMDIAEELFWVLCEADDLQGAIDLLTLLDDDRSDAEMLEMVARLEIGLGRLAVADTIAAHVDSMDPPGAALIRVELALARHDRAGAEQAAAAIPAGSPPAAVAQRLLGDAALDDGDVARARALLAPLATDARGQALLEARIRAHAHDVQGVLAALAPVLRANPDDLAALNLAGYVMADGRVDLPLAERYLRRARQLAPGDPAVLDSWGWLLLAEGKPREAVTALEHAARFAPLEQEILAHLDAARRAARATMRP